MNTARRSISGSDARWSVRQGGGGMQKRPQGSFQHTQTCFLAQALYGVNCIKSPETYIKGSIFPYQHTEHSNELIQRTVKYLFHTDCGSCALVLAPKSRAPRNQELPNQELGTGGMLRIQTGFLKAHALFVQVGENCIEPPQAYSLIIGNRWLDTVKNVLIFQHQQVNELTQGVTQHFIQTGIMKHSGVCVVQWSAQERPQGAFQTCKPVFWKTQALFVQVGENCIQPPQAYSPIRKRTQNFFC